MRCRGRPSCRKVGVGSEKKIDLLSRAWVLVVPSIREGFGLNTIEAAACGTPSVAYRVHGLKDSIKDNCTGLLVKSQDIQELSQGLRLLLENDMLRKNISENALKYSQQFSWEKSAQEFMDIIQNARNL